MKKFSILITLLLCLTIAGVYATWSYAGTDDIADAFAEAKITIEDAELVGSNGTYSITSNLVLTIDQKATDDHTAVLEYASNNDAPIYLTVKFTPASHASLKIKEEAIPSELYFGTTVTMQYPMDAEGNYSETGTPKDILWFSNVSNGELDVNIAWTKQDDGSFICTYNEAQLKEMIKLNPDVEFVLDTKAEHDEFRLCLVGNVVARVTDGTVN